MAFKRTNLAGFARTLRALKKVPSQVSTELAAWATERMRQDIEKGVTSYGAGHRSLSPITIRKKGHGRPLIHGRALVGSILARALGGAGITIEAPVAYLGFLLYGTKNMDPIPPTPVSGLPATWRAEIKRLLSEKIRETL